MSNPHHAQAMPQDFICFRELAQKGELPASKLLSFIEVNEANKEVMTQELTETNENKENHTSPDEHDAS